MTPEQQIEMLAEIARTKPNARLQASLNAVRRDEKLIELRKSLAKPHRSALAEIVTRLGWLAGRTQEPRP